MIDQNRDKNAAPKGWLCSVSKFGLHWVSRWNRACLVLVTFLVVGGIQQSNAQSSQVELKVKLQGDVEAKVKGKTLNSTKRETTIFVTPTESFKVTINWEFGETGSEGFSWVDWLDEIKEDAGHKPLRSDEDFMLWDEENNKYIYKHELFESGTSACEPPYGYVEIIGGCSMYYNDGGEWKPGSSVSVEFSGITPQPNNDPLVDDPCAHAPSESNSRTFRLTDPNKRDEDGEECPYCGNPAGNDGTPPSYSPSNYDTSFGSGFDPQTGKATGPIYLNLPINSTQVITRDKFDFAPIGGITTSDTDDGTVRTILTPHSRIEIRDLANGVEVKIFDDLTAGAPPTEIRKYLRVTDATYGDGIRYIREKDGKTHTRDFFESVSADGLTRSWKKVSDGTEVKEGIETVVSGVNGEWTRTVQVSTSVVDAQGNSTLTNQSTRIFNGYPWGEVLYQEIEGLPGDFDTTTYTYHTNINDQPRLGKLHYWIDSDGDWERHFYDNDGEKTETRRPWLDGPVDPATAEMQDSRSTVFVGDDSEEWILGIKLDTPDYAELGDTSSSSEEEGNWDEATGTFTPGGNQPDTRYTRIQNISPTNGNIVNKTTKTVSISDRHGTQSSKTYVYTGPDSWAFLSETVYHYDTQGRATQTITDGDVMSSTVYNADGSRTVTQQDGSSYTYASDDTSSTNTWHGGGVFSDMVTTTTEQGNTSMTTRTAGGLTITSSSISTPRGELISSTDEQGRTTTYNSEGRTETETGPGGVTRVRTTYLDGQLKSITGSGVVNQYYDYTVNADGTITTMVTTGTQNSPRWRKTITNGLGQTLKEERPGPNGGVISRIYHYDNFGRVERIERTGLADELVTYDELGDAYRRGYDMDANGSLDSGSTDRITETSRFYEDDGGWWQVGTNSVYQEDGNAAPTEMRRTRQKMGLGADSLSEYTSGDGTVITTTTTVDAATGTTTVTADSNLSDIDAVSIYRYGRQISQSSFTVATAATYGYDALGRMNSVTDPRTGLTTTVTFTAAGQYDTITQPGPNGPITTKFGYYPATHPSAGQVHWMENGLGKRTYYAYSHRGETTHQWGAASYPLRYDFNEYGELAQLRTFRGGEPSLWDGEALPGAFANFAANATGLTTWNYDPASGVLVSKLDSDGKGPTYTYFDSGLTQTRTWARGIVTTYGYNLAGNLTSTSYSDGTPGMTRTYRRDGSVKTITDANGTITYAHTNPGGQPSSETFSGGLFNGMTLSYPAAAGGLRQSFTASLGGTTLSQMSYGYNNQSKLQTVSEPNIGVTATYGYTPNSDLINTITTADGNGATVLTGTRTYDNANRLDTIGYSKPGGAVVTSHDYTVDNAHRRTRVDRENGEYWGYGYNDRGEVTSAKKHLQGGSSIAGWQQEYKFDNIGNRLWQKEGGDANGNNLRQTDYTPTNLNQYSQLSNPGAFSVVGKAPQSVNVTVNDQAVTRQGDYWHYEFPDIDNEQGSAYENVTIKATDPGAGPNGEDVVEYKRGNWFVPPILETPFHDDDGNLLTDGRWNYTWNGENRLVQMETGAAALISGVPKERFTFDYDSQGRRFRKQIEKWDDNTNGYQQTKEERFVYDQWNVVAMLDENNAVKQRYAWGTDLSGSPQEAGGVGGLLAASDINEARSWAYSFDGNGNVSAVVDLADGSTGYYDYNAFGETIATWGDEELVGINQYRFSTKLTDESGLLYYGFRYYMPTTGRWASRDPIEERGGYNLYGFVGNDGVGEVDLLGMLTYLLLWGEEKGVPFEAAARAKGREIEESAEFDSCCDEVQILKTTTFTDLKQAIEGYDDIIQIYLYSHSGPGILFLNTSGTTSETNVTFNGGEYTLRIFFEPFTFNSSSLKGISTENIAKGNGSCQRSNSSNPKKRFTVYGCNSLLIANQFGTYFRMRSEGIEGSCLFPVENGVPTPTSTYVYHWKQFWSKLFSSWEFPPDMWYGSGWGGF